MSAAYGQQRTWTDRAGKTFNAELLAADGLRATLLVEGRGKVAVPIASLSKEDATFVRDSRLENLRMPIVDPEAMAAWPAEAVAESFEVQLVPSDATPRWDSAHFSITSDVKLPTGVVRDLAAVLEATRAAVIAAPIGLHGGVEIGKYPVRLFGGVPQYTEAGGPQASGGFFVRPAMLILLPNIGILPTTNGLSAQHHRHLFVLKHEVTHQLMTPWSGRLPMWLNEGLAETFAAAPYTRGRYTFQNLDSALRDYVLKWRATRDTRSIRLIAPQQLMSLTSDEWNQQVSAQNAYDLYNSTALLTHFFLRHDGRGDSAGIAGFLAALRTRMPEEEAEKRYLLRGRTRDQITTEVKAMARKMAIEIRD